MIFDDGSSFIGYSASRVVDPATGRPERSQENIGRTLRADRAVLAARRRDVPARCSTPTSATGSRRSAGTASAPRRRGARPTRSRSCSTCPAAAIEPVHQFMTLRPARPRLLREPRAAASCSCARRTTSTGCFPDDVPGLQGLVHCLPLTLSFEPAAIAVGRQPGDHRRADGRGPPARVEYATSSEVDRISSRTAAPSRSSSASGERIATDLVVSDLGRAADGPAPAARRRGRPTASGGASRTSTTTAASCSGPTSRSTSRRVPRRGRQPRRRERSRACTGARRTSTTLHAALPGRDLPGRLRAAAVRAVARSTACGTRRARRAGSHIVGVEEFAAPRRLFAPERLAPRQAALHRQPAARVGALRAEHDAATTSSPLRVYAPDDIERERPDMVEGGYSAGSTIASQLGRFRPVPGAARPPDAPRQRLQLLGEPALRLGDRPRVELHVLRGDRCRPRAHGARRGGLSARSRHAVEISSPTAISPSLTMSARRPPRWMSARSVPGLPSRAVRRSRCAQGSHNR